MDLMREKVDPQGRISIKRILQETDIKPGDLVEIIPGKNRIVLKAVRTKRSAGVIERVAGKWKNRPDLAADILGVR